MRTVHRLQGESGSMPFALIGIILVAGLCAALFSTTIATQRSVREDRQFHRALNGSDAGVQQALTQISELPDNGTSHIDGTATVDGVEFEWSAARTGSQWEVTSQGVAGEQTRTVEATIERHGTFLVGAFADLRLTLLGNNHVDSYNSATGATDTGVGSVGSNGDIILNGGAFADVVMLYGDATCTGHGAGNGCDDGQVSGQDSRFDIEAIENSIAATIDSTCGDTFEDYVASSYGPLVAGETYCFLRMEVDRDVEIQAAADGSPPSVDNPVTILLDGNFYMKKKFHLNCSGCDAAGATPDSGALQIYGTGDTFDVENHANIAAAIAMPAANCEGPAAQAHIYGALLCDEIKSRGGWKFHYDEALENVDSGFWDITGWREEMQGESSF